MLAQRNAPKAWLVRYGLRQERTLRVFHKSNRNPIYGFDWDGGNIQKCQKHGVSIEEIEALFCNPKVAIAPDIKHSEAEERFLAVGMSIKDRHIFVVFTFREIQEEKFMFTN